MPKPVLGKHLYGFIDLREARVHNTIRIFGEADRYYCLNVIDQEGNLSRVALTEFDFKNFQKRALKQCEIPPPAGKWRTIWALLTNKIRCNGIFQATTDP